MTDLAKSLKNCLFIEGIDIKRGSIERGKESCALEVELMEGLEGILGIGKWRNALSENALLRGLPRDFEIDEMTDAAKMGAVVGIEEGATSESNDGVIFRGKLRDCLRFKSTKPTLSKSIVDLAQREHPVVLGLIESHDPIIDINKGPMKSCAELFAKIGFATPLKTKEQNIHDQCLSIQMRVSLSSSGRSGRQ
jgi:hypothetical protein